MNQWQENSNFQCSASTIYFCFGTTDDVNPHANFWVKYRYEAPGWFGGKLMEENHSTGHSTLGVLIIGSCWKNCLWLLRHKLFQGVLAQARKWWQVLLGREILQPMGRPEQALKVTCFFSFQVWGEKDFFHFSLGSQYVLAMFPLSSQWELASMFPEFLMYSPTCSPQHLTFIPYALPMLSSFHLYISGKGEEFHGSMVAFAVSFEWWPN